MTIEPLQKAIQSCTITSSLDEPSFVECDSMQKSESLFSLADRILPGLLSYEEFSDTYHLHFYLECVQLHELDCFLQKLTRLIQKKSNLIIEISLNTASQELFHVIQKHFSDYLPTLRLYGSGISEKILLPFLSNVVATCRKLVFSNCQNLTANMLNTTLLFANALTSLSLEGCSLLQESDLIRILRLKLSTLSELDLSGCSITDTFFLEMPSHVSLQKISLSKCQNLTKVSLVKIVETFGLKLSELDLSHTLIDSHDVISALKSITLSKLFIQGCSQFSDATVEIFCRHFSEIRILDIRQTMVSYQGITKLLSVCKKLEKLTYDPPTNGDILSSIPETQLAFYFNEKHEGMPRDDAEKIGMLYFNKTTKTKAKVFRIKEWAERYELEVLYNTCAAYLSSIGIQTDEKTFETKEDLFMFEDDPVVFIPPQKNDSTYPEITIDSETVYFKGSQEKLDSFSESIIISNIAHRQVHVTFKDFTNSNSRLLHTAKDAIKVLEIERAKTLTDSELLTIRCLLTQLNTVKIADCFEITYVGWIQSIFQNNTASIYCTGMKKLGSVELLSSSQEYITLLQRLLAENNTEYISRVVKQIKITEKNAPTLFEYASRNEIHELKDRIIEFYNYEFSSLVYIEAGALNKYAITFYPVTGVKNTTVSENAFKHFLKVLKDNASVFEVSFGPDTFLLDSQQSFHSYLAIVGAKVQKAVIVYPDFMKQCVEISNWLSYFPMLLSLELTNFPFSFEILLHVIDQGPGIFELSLCHCTSLSNQEFRQIIGHDNMKNIQKLVISQNNRLTDKDIAYICQSCPKIQHLDLSGLENITDNVLFHIDMLLKNLVSLVLDATNLSLDNFDGFANLETLSLAMCSSITDESLSAIATRCPKLKKINLFANSQLTDCGVLHLRGHKALKDIRLDGCKNIHKSDDISKK